MSDAIALSEFVSDSIPRPHPAIETVYLAPEAVVLDERDGRVVRFNAPAAATWLLLDGQTTVDEIVGELGEIFSTPAELVLPGVLEALHEFGGLGLLEVDRPDAPSEDLSAAEPTVLVRPPDP